MVFNTFPNFPVDYQKLVQQIYKCVAKFRNVGTVGQKAGSGAHKKRIPEIVAVVSARMKQFPKKTSPQVSPRDGPLKWNSSQNIKTRFKSSFL
jgi:hypothetical protein